VKRLVASRKLQRNCLYCNKSFKKGDVYYKHRVVTDETYFASKINLFTSEHLICARCEYKKKEHVKRQEKFKKNCAHPKKFIQEIWSYIPGESIMQPDHLECSLCGTIL
jgi:hypothetical protein